MSKIVSWTWEYENSLKNDSKKKTMYENFKKSINEKVFIGLEGNFGYIIYYCREKLIEFLKSKDLDEFEKRMKEIIDNYNDTDSCRGVHVAKDLLADVYLYTKDYDRFWDMQFGKYIRNDNKFAQILRYEHLLNVKLKCTDNKIDGHLLLKTIPSTQARLTPLGEENLNRIADLVTIYLNKFEKENGKNIIQYFADKYDFWNLSENEFDEIGEYLTKARLLTFKNVVKHQQATYRMEKSAVERGENIHTTFFGYYVFNPPGAQGFFELNRRITYKRIPQMVDESMKALFISIFRECENIFREERNIPRIGEGWVSETNLYYEIDNIFKDEKIIQHGRPEWLGRQHMDIYFPKRNIAIEYQGEQHNRPISYFGGEEAYLVQIERDNRKKKLCEKNNCKLVYVHEGYDINSIADVIRNYINSLNS